MIMNRIVEITDAAKTIDLRAMNDDDDNDVSLLVSAYCVMTEDIPHGVTAYLERDDGSSSDDESDLSGDDGSDVSGDDRPDLSGDDESGLSGDDGSRLTSDRRPGLTGDKEVVHPGDHLAFGDKVKIGKCREW